MRGREDSAAAIEQGKLWRSRKPRFGKPYLGFSGTGLLAHPRESTRCATALGSPQLSRGGIHVFPVCHRHDRLVGGSRACGSGSCALSLGLQLFPHRPPLQSLRGTCGSPVLRNPHTISIASCLVQRGSAPRCFRHDRNPATNSRERSYSEPSTPACLLSRMTQFSSGI